MQIHGPTHVHGSQPISAPHRAAAPQTNASPQGVSGADQLDISREAELFSRLREVPDIRSERVAELKSAIESGAYETDEKLDVAVDRLLDEIA